MFIQCLLFCIFEHFPNKKKEEPSMRESIRKDEGKIAQITHIYSKYSNR